jgi:hypothetical protein
MAGALGLALAAQASAATTVGQLFAPNAACSNSAILQASVPSGNSYQVPAGGVITSWSFRTGSQAVKGIKLKVGRSGGGTSYTIVGESAGGALAANAVNTRAARVPVKKGDYIGIYAASGHCKATTASKFDIYAQYAGDPAVGSTSEDWPYHGNAKVPVQAKVEADQDADAFGDESQDRCPGTPGQANGCPAGSTPPPGGDALAPTIGSLTATSRGRRRVVFRYTLSEGARVVFRIARKLSGRRVNGRCRRASPRNRNRRRCMRLIAVGRFVDSGAAGQNRRSFAGKIGKRKLRPGRYRAALTARDVGGNVSVRRFVAFRIRRR